MLNYVTYFHLGEIIMARFRSGKRLAILALTLVLTALSMAPLPLSILGRDSVQSVSAAVPLSSKRIVGYFVQWGIYKRNYLVKNVSVSGSAERLTHLNYAFGDVTTNYQCATADAFADYNKAFSATESVDGVGDVSSQKLKG